MPNNSTQKVLIEPVVLPENMALSEFFAHVSETDMAILLDSASQQSDSRFSIMLWSPFCTIKTRAGITTVTDTVNQTSTVTSAKPFDSIKQSFQSFFDNLDIVYPHDCDDLPFVVGMAGLAGYDVARYYESLPNQAKNDYVCDDLAVGCYYQSLIEDKLMGNIYHCRVSHLPKLNVKEFISQKGSGEPFKLTGNWQSNLSREAYSDALDAINRYLHAGDCYQVNMAQRFSAPYCGNPFEAYTLLRHKNQAPFSSFIRTSQSAVLSISPERFLKVDKNKKVETKPIKGTKPRHQDPQIDMQIAESLLASEKDRAENLMIVDLLRNDVSKHCKPHSVDVPALFAIESYPAVHHMVSTVVGELNESATPIDLFEGAFPGGSITGAPKVRAMEIIDELEPHRRNIYCGSIFYYGAQGDFDSSICIRTLLAEDGVVHCWAGGGIVIDSQTDSEYQETLDKVNKILPVLTNQSVD